MSESRRPARISAIAFSSDSRVTSTSRRRSGDTSPTVTVSAESPCNPSSDTPKSMLTTSQAWMVRGPGIPCTISSFTEMQITAGYGGRPPGP